MRNAVVAGVGLAALGGGALLVSRWARRRLLVVTVTGPSMQPTLRDGDRILVRRRRPDQLRHGDVVVLAAPAGLRRVGDGWQRSDGGLNVKRVDALPGDPVPADVPAPDGTGLVPPGSVVVRSDNPAGVDSRSAGPFPVDGLVGTAVTLRAGRPLGYRCGR